jgi:Domain of Unknown Function (DUF1259)
MGFIMTIGSLVLGLLLVSSPAQAPAPQATPAMPAEYQSVLTFLNRQGDFSANVLRVNIPRNDLSVTVAGVATPTPFGFGGWLAMTKGDGNMQVMMGDLVLLQDEVGPVMSALLEHGLEVTALHNHFFWDEPRMAYMHVHGHGTPMALAEMVKPALDLIGSGAGARGAGRGGAMLAPPAPAGQMDTAKISALVGQPGVQTGAVFKITVGRADLKISEMGAAITSRMGLNSWASFVGTDAKAAVAGDIAMLADEVTPVQKALREHGLEVVAIHQHMTSTQPTIFFLHYWGTGPASQLAAGFKAALDRVTK